MTLEFVHIPKTGGTAITLTYKDLQWGNFADLDKVCERLFYYDLKAAAIPCSYWHNHTLIDTLYKGSKTFCVFRDPIDRILSEYRFQRFFVEGNVLDDDFSFNTTLEGWKIEVEKNPYFLDNHLAPQHLFAEQCDHVLLFDFLEKEVNELVEQYGITPRKLEKENVNISFPHYRHVKNRDVISDENMEWLQSYYATDLEWYERLKKERKQN